MSLLKTFKPRLLKSLSTTFKVVQNLATGEIADSVREIASFRTKIKDIGSKVDRLKYMMHHRL